MLLHMPGPIWLIFFSHIGLNMVLCVHTSSEDVYSLKAFAVGYTTNLSLPALTAPVAFLGSQSFLILCIWLQTAPRLFHLFFRAVAIVTHLPCDWISENFASCFVLIITSGLSRWEVSYRSTAPLCFPMPHPFHALLCTFDLLTFVLCFRM